MLIRYTTLIEALEWSVENIAANYSSAWMKVVDDSGIYDSSSTPKSAADGFNEVFEPQIHSYMEICICLSNRFAVQTNSSIRELTEGDVCLILPGVLHSELAKKNHDYESIWISVYSSKVSIHLSGIDSNDGFFCMPDEHGVKSICDCEFFIKSICDEASEKAPFFYDLIKTNSLQLLLLILRMIKEQAESNLNNTEWKETVATQIKHYIEKNYFRGIRLSEVAHELHLSPNYLNSKFKSVTGKTVIQYLEEYRITKAKQLLDEDEYNINVISKQLGFYDQYHFSKIFKKVTGCSPTDYKNIANNN